MKIRYCSCQFEKNRVFDIDSNTETLEAIIAEYHAFITKLIISNYSDEIPKEVSTNRVKAINSIYDKIDSFLIIKIVIFLLTTTGITFQL